MGNVANRVIDFGKKVGSTVLDVGRKARDWIGGAFNTIKRIPIIGGIAEKLVDIPTPLGGLSARQITDMGSKAIDAGGRIEQGDIIGGITDGMRIRPR